MIENDEVDQQLAADMVQAKQQASTNLTDTVSLNADEIVPGLFLGSENAARDLKSLEKHNIKHILIPARTGTERYHFPGKLTYLIWDIYDVPGYPIIWSFDVFAQHIHEALANNEGVLVHCANGVSRSPAIVAAYLLKYHTDQLETEGVDLVTAAYSLMRTKRTKISDRKFKAQLQLYVQLDCDLTKYVEALISGQTPEEVIKSFWLKKSHYLVKALNSEVKTLFLPNS